MKVNLKVCALLAMLVTRSSWAEETPWKDVARGPVRKRWYGAEERRLRNMCAVFGRERLVEASVPSLNKKPFIRRTHLARATVLIPVWHQL